MSSLNPSSTTYRIEISGWDEVESFFVEKADLEWSEEHGKKVTLRHRLRNGAVVFIRLLVSTAWSRSIPIAYQVENVSAMDPAGFSQIRLVQLHPRTSEQVAGPQGFAEVSSEKLR